MYMSEEKKKYLRNIRKNNFIVLSSRILIFILFLVLWEFSSKIGIINTFTFSSPSRVFYTLIELVQSGNLFNHLFVTFYEVTISFLLASVIGLISAIILWRWNLLARIVDPYLTILNSLPKVALGPLIIIWVGASINSIVFMSLLISTFITIINIYSGFITTDSGYITLMKSFGANKFQVFTKVIFPSNIGILLNALKINISMNLIGVIMGELLVSKEGIGYLIMYGSQVFNIDLVIAGVFILGIVSYFMYYIINKLSLRINNK